MLVYPKLKTVNNKVRNKLRKTDVLNKVKRDGKMHKCHGIIKNCATPVIEGRGAQSHRMIRIK